MSQKVEREQVNENQDQSYWAIVKRQFRKNRTAVWSLRIVYIIIFFGLSADFLANEKPIYCKIDGESYFPILQSYGVQLGITKWPKELATIYNWRTYEYDAVVRALVPYSPGNMDRANFDFVGPFEEQKIASQRWRHWLGTDEIGRDILSGMIHGSRVAMMVGIVSMSISSIIGIIIGAFAGYFGDNRMKVSRIRIILTIAALIFGCFYAFSARNVHLSEALEGTGGSFIVQLAISMAIFVGIFAVAMLLSKLLKKVPVIGQRIVIPLDIFISRFIEIFVSVPRLLLILSVVAIVPEPSLLIVMAVIGLTSWTGIARLIRGELLRVRSLEYIEAAQALGYSESRIIMRHAIPNALTSVLVAIAFGVASAILIESFLSFLSIGVPPEAVTWGSMLSEARNAPEAWWMVLSPGLAIFITVLIFNLMGEGLTDALDPRLKQ